MTGGVITASPQDDLEAVLQTMSARHIRHLPIMDQQQLAGIVSIRDVVKAQLDRYLGEVDTLETQILEEHA
jgi:CBS domain-containing protein